MLEKESDLTYKEVCQMLEYNPDTGLFVWLNDSEFWGKGDLAGKRSARGYIYICIMGRTFGAHRLAWLIVMQEWPKDQIDHINHVRDDNRIINLRVVSAQENMKNLPLAKKNKTGVSGVSVIRGGWQAIIGVNGEPEVLGSFNDFFDACCARKSAENKYGYHANHGR